MSKAASKVALFVIAAIIVFALVSFLRENWSANESPGIIETVLAKWALNRARSSEADARNPFAPTPENLDDGKAAYEKQCAFCHGSDGKGQSETGIQFYPPVPPLAGGQHELTDGQISSIISQGIRYTAMPSFTRALPPDEIWKVVLWVRHLQSQQP